jgi:predicted PurR-regulated permease PerM
VPQARGLLVLVLGYLLARFLLPHVYPLLLAMALAFSVEPMIRLLAARGMPRPVAAVLALGGLGTALFVTLALVVRAALQEALHMAAGLPGVAHSLSQRLAQVWPERLLGPPPALPVHFLSQVTAGAGRIALQLPDTALAIVVAAVGAYLVARELPDLRVRLRKELPMLMPQRSLQIGRVAFDATLRYLKAQLLLASVTTCITGLGLLLVGAPYALLAAVAVGILDIAPALGPATVLGPWAAGAALLGSYGLAIRIALVLLVAAVVRPTLEPRLVGGQIGLHPLAALATMYIGVHLFGAVGLAVGPVLAATAWAAYHGEARS